jgi:Fe-S oxidoreductase
LRDYLFGYFDLTARLASAFAPLTNAVMGVPLFKNAIAKALSITERRPFPKFTTRRAKAFTTESTENTEKSRILFLSDPFGRYVEPEVEQAAFDVLAACGCNVRVLPVVGAGASLLSKGFVDAAKRHAAKVLDALEQADPTREAVILGLEPPDIYCLKNDYFDLLPERREEIASLAARTWLLDEYLVRSDGFRNLRVGRLENPIQSPREEEIVSPRRHGDASSDYRPPRNDRILIQPHCHQRAQGPSADGLPSGTNATVEMLKLCGYDVDVLDTGCCGMAGTFGYEAGHYELSMQVGELKLFPILRKSKVEGLKSKIAGSGAACRMQIGQGAGVEALHPIVLVAQALAGYV